MDKWSRSSITTVFLSWIFLIFTSPIIILLITTTLIYRWIVTIFLCRIFHPEFVRPVTGLDVGFSLDDFWNVPRGAIAFVHIIDGQVDPMKIKGKLEKVLFSSSASRENYERLISLYPKIWLSFPFWTKIGWNEFKIENHIRIKTELVNSNSINILINDWIKSPFQYECPLWDVLIIPQLKQNDKLKSLFGFRIHHTVGDGYSMLQFLQKIFDDQDSLPKSAPVPIPRVKIPLQNKIWDEFQLTLLTPFIMYKFVHDFFLHQDWLMRRKSSRATVFATTSFKLEDLKRIRRKVGSHVSLNTIILHLFGGALRQYLVKNFGNEILPFGTIVVCTLPVYQKEHPVGIFCNHWNHGTFIIPLQEPNRLERMRILTSNVTWVLQLRLQKVYSRFAIWAAYLPTFLLEKLVHYNVSASIGMANLPGPCQHVFLFGEKVERKLAVVGIQWEHASIEIAVFSYNGEVTMSITANQDVIPDVKTASKILNEYFMKELKDELAAFD